MMVNTLDWDAVIRMCCRCTGYLRCQSTVQDTTFCHPHEYKRNHRLSCIISFVIYGAHVFFFSVSAPVFLWLFLLWGARGLEQGVCW
ncbi:hypothetical protein XELAEV_18033402mg [Xenopus laevis]|uniref:Uncharacterized protein n=1 Tax=Xenopus laevis TaxID=8355 RepID=A0A974CJ63_XENLA|nr:hypothetical protein XELAEV_18033402mg [Xenopus laevis]